MSSSTTGLRAVRQLREEGGAITPRPGSSSARNSLGGSRPTTATAAATATATATATASAAASSKEKEDLKAEIEQLKLALDKEKRNSSSLESYILDLTSKHEQELAFLYNDVKNCKLQKEKSELSLSQMSDDFQKSLSQLRSQVERLSSSSSSAPDQNDKFRVFTALFREEMKAMQEGYDAKIDMLQNELQDVKNSSQKQIRTLNDTLTEERKMHANVNEKKINSLPSSPTSSSSSSSASASKSSSSSSSSSSSTRPPSRPSSTAGTLSARASINKEKSAATSSTTSTKTSSSSSSTATKTKPKI